MDKAKFKWRLDFIVVILIAALIIALVYQGTNIDYKIEKGNISINWFTGVIIPIKDIAEIKVLDKAPKMKKIIGVELFGIKQGTFDMEGFGRVKVYSGDISRKMVIVRTKQFTYGLTPDNTTRFVKLISN